MKRVLLDENLPRKLARELRFLNIAADSFPAAWKGLTNGKLLEKLEAEKIDVLLTADTNIAYQQTMRDRSFAVISLPTNRLSVLIRSAKSIADTISAAVPASCIFIRPDGRRFRLAFSREGISEIEIPPTMPFS